MIFDLSDKTSINKCEFVRSSIDIDVIPDNIKKIEKYAFHRCYNIKSLTLNENIEYIGSHAFDLCLNIETVNFNSDKITRLPNSIFHRCFNLKDIVFHDNLLEIGDSAFEDDVELINVAFPDKLRLIGKNAFSNCIKLKNVIFPKSLKQINSYAFSDTAIEFLDVSEHLYISDNAFFSCLNLNDLHIYSKHLKLIKSWLGEEYNEKMNIYVKDANISVNVENLAELDEYKSSK